MPSRHGTCEEIISQIRQLAIANSELGNDLDFGPVPVEKLRQVESELGVRLPDSFRAYLLGFAGGRILGYEMCGIPTEKSKVPDFDGTPVAGNSIIDIVVINKELRRGMPEGFVYFTGDGGDFAFCIDTHSEWVGWECPVVMCGPGADGTLVAESFLDFLHRLARRESFSRRA